MVHDEECTTEGDGPDPYSMCKFPFWNSGILISDCISIFSPSASNKACKRISNQVTKTHGKFPPNGYSQVCILYLYTIKENENFDFSFKIDQHLCILYLYH